MFANSPLEADTKAICFISCSHWKEEEEEAKKKTAQPGDDHSLPMIAHLWMKNRRPIVHSIYYDNSVDVNRLECNRFDLNEYEIRQQTTKTD